MAQAYFGRQRQPSHRDDVLLGAVEMLASELVRTDPLGTICSEHLASGGGKLRARLALSAAQSLGVDTGSVVGWAAACELLHNATLIHDDLQDRDAARRGAPTVWRRHGDAQAINAGDLLLMLPYRAVERIPAGAALRWLLTRAIAKRAEETVRAQSLEMTLLQRRPWQMGDYEAAASGKTGALIGLPIEGAALIAGIDPDESRALGDAFRDLGLVYQLQDDVVDLFGSKRRDRRGADILEGKVTSLVVEHVRLHPHEEDWLFEILSCPRELTTSNDIDAVASRFDSGGALEAVVERALHLTSAVLERPCFRVHPALRWPAHELAERCLAPMRPLRPKALLSESVADAH